jgi:hypothetical protein
LRDVCLLDYSRQSSNNNLLLIHSVHPVALLLMRNVLVHHHFLNTMTRESLFHNLCPCGIIIHLQTQPWQNQGFKQDRIMLFYTGCCIDKDSNSRSQINRSPGISFAQGYSIQGPPENWALKLTGRRNIQNNRGWQRICNGIQ